MLKFRQVKEKNCLAKYKVNKPKINLQQPRTSLPNKTEPIAQAKSFSSSLKQSINRTFRQSQKLKPKKEQMFIRSYSKPAIKQLKRNQTEPSDNKRFTQIKQYILSITKTNKKNSKRMTYQVEKDASEKREENKRFMLRHMSFTEVEEDKINEQKEYLRKLKQFKGTESKAMMETFKLYDLQLKKQQQKLIQSFKSIEKIYIVLQEMEKLGYQIKSNKYLIYFCTEVKNWLTCIFLQESKDKKDAFLVKTKYFVLTSCLDAKKKLSDFISRADKMELSAIINDLHQLLNHMENSLTHKKIIEIQQVENYVQSRMMHRKNSRKANWEDLRISKYKHQDFDFAEHLTQLEDKYGPMREISKVSRCRFLDLNKTYERLLTLL